MGHAWDRRRERELREAAERYLEFSGWEVSRVHGRSNGLWWAHPSTAGWYHPLWSAMIIQLGGLPNLKRWYREYFEARRRARQQCA